VDTEWLLSTLFDASLLSLEPPKWRLFFVRFEAMHRIDGASKPSRKDLAVTAGQKRRLGA
jgi:hypothetical protein